jgi:hypothetical protein
VGTLGVSKPRLNKQEPNKALHRTAILLHFIATGELGRYATARWGIVEQTRRESVIVCSVISEYNQVLFATSGSTTLEYCRAQRGLHAQQLSPEAVSLLAEARRGCQCQEHGGKYMFIHIKAFQERCMNKPRPMLLDQLHEAMRLKHCSLKTEKSYIHWVRRFNYFYHRRHLQEMGAAEVQSFLNQLAVGQYVAASTQNQTLNVLVSLYK